MALFVGTGLPRGFIKQNQLFVALTKEKFRAECEDPVLQWVCCGMITHCAAWTPVILKCVQQRMEQRLIQLKLV
jgi:hypothetical protein